MIIRKFNYVQTGNVQTCYLDLLESVRFASVNNWLMDSQELNSLASNLSNFLNQSKVGGLMASSGGFQGNIEGQRSETVVAEGNLEHLHHSQGEVYSRRSY